MMDREGPDDRPNVINLRPPGDSKPELPTPTISANRRRYTTGECKHRGPYLVDNMLGTVECGDCGAALNPIFVLEILAWHEAYWNARLNDLRKHLAEINKELEGRTRTKCTHCGNMTPIRFLAEMPRTWVPGPHGY